MKNLLSFVAGMAVLLTSCVIPEKFVCDINVTKDGAYSAKINGTLVYIGVFDEIKKNGKVSEKTDSDVKPYFDEAVKEEPAVTKYQYQKEGRAYLEYFKEVSDGSPLDLTGAGFPLKINETEDGVIIITFLGSSEKSRQQLEEYAKYGYQLDGKVTITSELPIIDAGGQKTGKKYLLFGPQVIKKSITMATIPPGDIVIKIGK